MTLRELVEKYDGKVSFAVSKIIPGGTDNIIEFTNDCHDAIKDEIMNGTVVKYSVVTTSNRVTTINVVIEEVSEDTTEDTTEDTPSDEPTSGDGTDEGADDGI